MKLTIKVGVAALLAAIGVAGQTPSYAADPAKSDQPGLAALGPAISTSQLAQYSAQGASIAVSSGAVSDNSVGSNSITGSNVIGSNAVTNNTGITTVFQNTGNNSLFQSSTSIYISVH
jgi:hypothetical protein